MKKVLKNKTPIIAVHVCGLCNRLDTIVAGYCLAEVLKKELIVQWPLHDFHMPVHFKDLFTALPDGVEVHETKNFDEAAGVLFEEQIEKYLPAAYRSQEMYRRHLKKIAAMAHPQVLSAVKEFTEGQKLESSIGVHIRRKESNALVSPLAQPLAFYAAEMRSFSNSQHFFICTDEPEAFTYMRKHFKDRVIQREKTYNNRSTAEGCREGFIDMLLLSHTQTIVGTSGSSFSGLAAMIGDRHCKFVVNIWSQTWSIWLLYAVFAEATLWKKILHRLYSFPIHLIYKLRRRYIYFRKVGS